MLQFPLLLTYSNNISMQINKIYIIFKQAHEIVIRFDANVKLRAHIVLQIQMYTWYIVARIQTDRKDKTDCCECLHIIITNAKDHRSTMEIRWPVTNICLRVSLCLASHVIFTRFSRRTPHIAFNIKW